MRNVFLSLSNDYCLTLCCGVKGNHPRQAVSWVIIADFNCVTMRVKILLKVVDIHLQKLI